MLKAYGTTGIGDDDLAEREKKLSNLKYSVIVEGNFLEYNNAEKWIVDNLNIKTIESVFFGKLAYDYGFIEYFFSNESDSKKFRSVIPNLYTTYTDGSCSKSDGYDKNVVNI